MLRSVLRVACASTANAAGRASARGVGFVQHRSRPRFLSGSTGPGGGGGAGAGGGAGGGQGGSGGEGQEQEPYDGGVSWKTFAPLALLFGGAGAYLSISRYESKKKSEEGFQAGEDGAGVARVEGTTGKIAIGGPWRLMDHNAKYVTNEDFKGQWLLMYFGFTYCPDICPNELMRMREILSTLDAQEATKEKLLPIFVTIDPVRDGPAQLKDYVQEWHPRMLGLSGKQEECDSAAKAFRVYYSKSQLGPDPMDYLIDHSVMFYLVDPDGEFVDYYAPNATHLAIANRIGDEIGKWELNQLSGKR